MGLGKQAKVLTRPQIEVVITYLSRKRNGLRYQTVFLLSTKSGLRAREISDLTWSMVLGSDGEVSSLINLTNSASKGKSGRIIPINKTLLSYLSRLYEVERVRRGFTTDNRVIRTERSISTTPQVIVNLFKGWYTELGFVGCSSHSGRRTFITNAARKISTVGGSLRDVQFLAGHSSLQTTQRYIEGDTQAQVKIVDLI
jgi:integrase/recombinase XerD